VTNTAAFVFDVVFQRNKNILKTTKYVDGNFAHDCQNISALPLNSFALWPRFIIGSHMDYYCCHLHLCISLHSWTVLLLFCSLFTLHLYSAIYVKKLFILFAV